MTRNKKKTVGAIAGIVYLLTLALLLILAFAMPMHAQTSNTFNVFQFRNAAADGTVGSMTTLAQNACNPNLNCVIILDPILNAYPQGNMPARCANCSWLDYRTPGSFTVTPTNVKIQNGIRYADQFASVQAAIADLSGSGGTVLVPPGSYVGPTSILNSNTTIACTTWLGCTFTYTTGQTFGFSGSELSGVSLYGIVFDFGGNNAGLTLQNFTMSTIAIRVQNTGSAAGVTFIAPTNAVGLNFMRNQIPWLSIDSAGKGLVLNGNANIACGGAQLAGGAVFDNTFGRLYITNITAGAALEMTSGTDGNSFQDAFLDVGATNTSSAALLLNSRCTAQAADVALNHFDYLTVEFLGNSASYSGNLVVINNSSTSVDHFVSSNVPSSRVLLGDPNGFFSAEWDGIDQFGLSVPYRASNRPTVQQVFTPATSGANYFAPCFSWQSQMWNGAATASSLWQMCPTAQSSGQPTFDTLIIQNSGSPNSNGFGGLGVQIPNRLLIAGPTGSLGIVTHANSGTRTYTFPDATGFVPLTGNGNSPLQTKRVAGCATAASAGAVCTTTVTWATAFADTSYTVSCGGDVVTSGVPADGGISAKVAASVTFRTVAVTAAAAQYANIDCTAIHD